MRAVISLDERDTVFAFRGVLFLAMLALLLHSPQQESLFQPAAFALAFAYLGTSLFFWRSALKSLQNTAAQAAAFIWDVGVVSSLVYYSEGFDNELYLVYFLIMFMSALMTQVWQGFLIGTVSCLLYAGLWARGHVGEGLPLTNLLLRFAFFYATAFFTAVMAHRVRSRESRLRTLEVRLALEKLANGGWGLAVEEGLEPNLAKTVGTVNALIDNLTKALERLSAQNEQLRATATDALLHLAREKERLEAQASRPRPAPAPRPSGTSS